MFPQFNRFVASAFNTGINNAPVIARSLVFTSVFLKTLPSTAALSGIDCNFLYCLPLMKARGQEDQVRRWKMKPNSLVDFQHDIKINSHL